MSSINAASDWPGSRRSGWKSAKGLDWPAGSDAGKKTGKSGTYDTQGLLSRYCSYADAMAARFVMAVWLVSVPDEIYWRLLGLLRQGKDNGVEIVSLDHAKVM